ncbi:hypothetical protein A3K86_22010 [Photobacterium jeanii]|uniref:Uncharacterized protein n=1 Tax=Photobacterium jeanii TaxID=858640 RepID=A0A178K3S7_9GAMM|nr:hypothetical protein [Photobacterium jeanii]OAN11595.1 hypothetical protein A3K86_22010 [Photobacterium jeanii]PST91116.1 hypothetical protein C9I91_11115 [Photobacterium jeanii]
MTVKNRIRQNLTNYDVLEYVRDELKESEKRMTRKLFFAHALNVVLLICFITVFFVNQGGHVRDYASEAMRKAFEAERAVHIIDEAAGTNFLEQSRDEK